MKKYILYIGLSLTLVSCSIIKPHQVGIKSNLGKANERVKKPGPVIFNPFLTRVIKVNICTANLSIKENLPSKEGDIEAEGKAKSIEIEAKANKVGNHKVLFSILNVTLTCRRN